MSSAKLLIFVAIVSALSVSVSGSILDNVFSPIVSEFYKLVPTKEGYRFNLEEPNGSKRDEMGVIINPGTPEEQLLVMGSYSYYDEKTDTDTITMYTAGYGTRYMIKNRKLSPKALMTSAG